MLKCIRSMLLNVSNSVISYCVRSALHPNRIKLIFYLFLVETDEDQNSGHDKKSSTAVADSFRRMFNEKHGSTMDLKILMMQIFSAWAKYTSTGESDEEKEVKTVEDEDGDGDTIGEVGGEDDDADMALRKYASEQYFELLSKTKLPDVLMQVICFDDDSC